MADLGKLNNEFIAHCKENFDFSPELLFVLDSYRDSNPYLRFFDINFFYIRNCFPNADRVVSALPKKEKREELEAQLNADLKKRDPTADAATLSDPTIFCVNVWTAVYWIPLNDDSLTTLARLGAHRNHKHRKKGAASAQRRNLTYYNILAQFVKHMDRFKDIITYHHFDVRVLFHTLFEDNGITAIIPVIDKNLISYLVEIDFPEAKLRRWPTISNTLILRFCFEISQNQRKFPPPFIPPPCIHGVECYQRNPVHRADFSHPHEYPLPADGSRSSSSDDDDDDDTTAAAAAFTTWSQQKRAAARRRGSCGGGKRTKRKKNRRTNPLRTKSRKTNSPKKTMKVDGDALGWRPRVRENNINKLLLKSHKNGMTKLVITNFGEKDDVYIVNNEMKKRKLSNKKKRTVKKALRR